MSEDCNVLTCEVTAWRDGYCWFHHQAWQRYLAALPTDEDERATPPVPVRRTPRQVTPEVENAGR